LKHIFALIRERVRRNRSVLLSLDSHPFQILPYWTALLMQSWDLSAKKDLPGMPNVAFLSEVQLNSLIAL
jgi:hypothetical protein